MEYKEERNTGEGKSVKKVTFAIMGMGNRGTAYAAKQLKFPE